MAFDLDGNAVAALLTGKDTPAERDLVYQALLAGGQVAPAIAKTAWPKVHLTGGGRSLELLVAPDVWAAGTSASPFRALGATPFFAQQVASAYFSILPSRKLQRDCQAQATLKLPYVDVKAKGVALSDIEKASSVVLANKMATEALASKGYGFGVFVRGYCKAIVCGPALDGTHVAIYGASWDATGTNIVQPYSTIHTSSFGDYSHGIWLIHRRCFLDGEEKDIRDLFLSDDPAIVALVSDQGRFDPTFPNASKSGLLASLGEQRGADFGLEGGSRAPDEPGSPGDAPASAARLGRLVTGGILGLAGAMALSLPPLWIAGAGIAGAVIAKATAK